jgi:hypothetical protein
MKFILLMGVVLLSLPVMAAGAWEKVKQNPVVTVYTKEVAGHPYRSFKAVGIVQTTPQKLLEVFDDVSSYSEWFAYANSVRLLKSEENRKYVYMETELPWPFSNEDMTYLIYAVESGGDAIKLILDGVPDYVPTVAGIMRMRDANGYILLQPVEDYTIVTYVMHTELGGDIPPWLANKYIHLMPFQTINNLINLAER